MIKAVVFLIVLMLKIVGILLLLGLFLFVCLLFVPVHYSIKGENSRIAESLALPEREGKNNGFQASAQIHVSWFLHLIHYTLNYGTNGVSGTIRIFGINIQKWAKKFRNFRNRKKQKNAIHTDTNMGQAGNPETGSSENISGKTEHTSQDRSGLKITDQGNDGSDTISQENTGEKKKKKPAEKTFQKKKNLRKKKKLQKKKRLQKEGSGNKDNQRNRIRSFYNEFTNQTNRQAVSHLWKEFLVLLRSFKPRKIKADFAFSLADPACTGYFLGFLSIFPFLYRYPCHIVPDFNSQNIYVEGEVFAKGKITVIVFLLSLFRLWRDKEVIYVFKRVTGRS